MVAAEVEPADRWPTEIFSPMFSGNLLSATLMVFWRLGLADVNPGRASTSFGADRRTQLYPNRR